MQKQHPPCSVLKSLFAQKAWTNGELFSTLASVDSTSAANIKSISYLKSHAAQITKELAINGHSLFITQNGEASMAIENVKQIQEKESPIAALKVMAMGEKHRKQGIGLSVAESRAQLAAARQRCK